MIYTPRDKLTIIDLGEYREHITFGEVAKELWERPANVIYAEKDGLLLGLITIGDIDRALLEGKECIKINTNFTYVFPNEYMRARMIFKDRSAINALPVKSSREQLLGEYARWDDLYRMGRLLLVSNGEYCKRFFLENNHVALVRPADIFENKRSFFDEMKRLLIQYSVTVEVIDRNELPEYSDKVKVLLFTDEDELRGTVCLCKNFIKEKIDISKCMTYCTFADSIVSTIANVTLSKVQRLGVRVFSLVYKENSEGWKAWLNKQIERKYQLEGEDKENSFLLPQFRKKFLEGIENEEYETQDLPFILKNCWEEEKRVVRNCEGPLLNIRNGERVTIGQPREYENSIYMIGPCSVVGAYVEDQHTIASFLQDRINREEMLSYKVINKGAIGVEHCIIDRLLDCPLREGDIVIMDDVLETKLQNIETINVIDIFSKRGAKPEWFVNSEHHFNFKANEMIAEELCWRILETECSKYISGRAEKIVELESDYVLEHYIKRYFESRDTFFEGKTGAIVMNCNPFTRGHRYLIEEACKKVDFLIIFVVEENQSVFSFNERYAMVCEGTSDLEKVIVVPSGAYILSRFTFPEYFVKYTDEEMKENIEGDVRLFAKRIAPYLNVAVRFVGEELQDVVTNEYNKAMQRILPNYGIEVIEIPRKMENNEVISASVVRKGLEQNSWEGVDKLVPESTRCILQYRNS